MDMNDQDCIMLGCFLLVVGVTTYQLLSEEGQKSEPVRRPRRFKVRPLNRGRKEHGQYATMFKFIKENDEEQFIKYTRMNVNQFNLLLGQVKPLIIKDRRKNPICAEERLAMTIRYLAEGCSMQQIALDYYVGKATAHKVITETCEAIWDALSKSTIPCPTESDLENVAEGYFKTWNMPNCVGALDGKHVYIQKPNKSGTEFFNYKKCNSIILMATCDAFYRFLFVDIGGYGSSHDSTVFTHSAFGSAILQKNEEMIKFPANKNLPNTQKKMPYFLVADQAFPLHERIMRPYPGQNLTEKQRIFNYRLSRARRTIENTFGILATRWRIFRKPIVAKVENVEKFVKAAVVLHNFIQTKELEIPIDSRKYCPTGFIDLEREGNLHHGDWRNEQPLESVGRVGANNTSRVVKQQRDDLADYFSSNSGLVRWQWNSIINSSW